MIRAPMAGQTMSAFPESGRSITLEIAEIIVRFRPEAAARGGKCSALLFSVAVLCYLVFAQAEPLQFTRRGMSLSTVAGVLGACGALGIVFALKFGGKPIFVAPLVFSGAQG